MLHWELKVTSSKLIGNVLKIWDSISLRDPCNHLDEKCGNKSNYCLVDKRTFFKKLFGRTLIS